MTIILTLMLWATIEIGLAILIAILAMSIGELIIKAKGEK